MANFDDISSNSLHLCHRDEYGTSDDDRLFLSEKARKAYLIFWKLAVSKNDKVSFWSLYTFDPVATQADDTFAMCSKAYVGHTRADAAIAPFWVDANTVTDVNW